MFISDVAKPFPYFLFFVIFIELKKTSCEQLQEDCAELVCGPLDLSNHLDMSGMVGEFYICNNKDQSFGVFAASSNVLLVGGCSGDRRTIYRIKLHGIGINFRLIRFSKTSE